MKLTKVGSKASIVISVVALGLLGTCSPSPDPPIPETDSQRSVVGRISFENRQTESQIDFVLNNDATADKHMIDSILGGVACFDFDGDGFLDIFFTNGGGIPSLAKETESFQNRLYRNSHNGTFTDVTERAKLTGEGYSMGVASGDFDNDGWGDLYVTGVNRNLLYRNRGDGTFIDVTEESGVSGIDASGKKRWSVSAAWADFDNDGDLDLFVANYLDWSFSSAERCGSPEERLHCSPQLYRGLPNLLYRNNGDGTFTDISAPSGIDKHVGKGMGVAVADYDSNGLIDIFVANDKERDFLFRNVDGETFAEVGVEVAVALTEDGLAPSSMGVDFRDLNNDGYPDLFVTALSGEVFPLFLNEGQGLFTDASYTVKTGLATMRLSGWGTGAYDFENDGYKDLFTANSHVTENIHLYTDYQYKLPNTVFQNQRNVTFRDVSTQAGLSMEPASAHRGSAFGDLNNDGKIDVVVSVIGDQPEILYGTSTGGGHWILVQAEGTESNRDGIGTKIKLTSESGSVQYNHVTTSVGYASSSDKRVHFGLGQDTQIREVELRWPSGKVQVLKDIAADQILIVKEN